MGGGGGVGHEENKKGFLSVHFAHIARHTKRSVLNRHSSAREKDSFINGNQN